MIKKRTILFILTILFLSPHLFADSVLDIYNKYKEEIVAADISSSKENLTALQDFHASISDFMLTQEFAVISVQQADMAKLVSQMQTSSASEVDFLMISYLEKSRAVLIKNQRYILFVTLLLSVLIIFVSVAVFYIVLIEEKKRIAKEILFELERERTRISFELHDTVAQEIAGASLILKSGERTEEAQRLLETSQKEIRSILSALNPPALEESPLETVLGELCSSFQKSSGIECSLNVAGDLSGLNFTAEEKLHIFRIVQESLTNIQKHSGATSGQVIFRKNGGGKKGWVLFVCDDGKGFDVQKAKGGSIDGENHFGLKNIEQRVSILGGSVKITSDFQNGTTIRVEVNR